MSKHFALWSADHLQHSMQCWCQGQDKCRNYSSNERLRVGEIWQIFTMHSCTWLTLTASSFLDAGPTSQEQSQVPIPIFMFYFLLYCTLSRSWFNSLVLVTALPSSASHIPLQVIMTSISGSICDSISLFRVQSTPSVCAYACAHINRGCNITPQNALECFLGACCWHKASVFKNCEQKKNKGIVQKHRNPAGTWTKTIQYKLSMWKIEASAVPTGLKETERCKEIERDAEIGAEAVKEGREKGKQTSRCASWQVMLTD